MAVMDVRAAGGDVVYLPKFHCELNPIERVWALAKQKARLRCEYTFAALQKAVPECLDEVSVASIRRFCRRAREFVHVYKNNTSSTCGDLEKLRKQQYKSHRRVGVFNLKQPPV